MEDAISSHLFLKGSVCSLAVRTCLSSAATDTLQREGEAEAVLNATWTCPFLSLPVLGAENCPLGQWVSLQNTLQVESALLV